MSFVTLILIKKNTISMLHQHWRTMQYLLGLDFSNIEIVKNQRSQTLDGGYIIINTQEKTIINAQSTFPLVTKKGYAVVQWW